MPLFAMWVFGFITGAVVKQLASRPVRAQLRDAIGQLPGPTKTAALARLKDTPWWSL